MQNSRIERSPEDDHCYAETLANRHTLTSYNLCGKDASRHISFDEYWEQQYIWNRRAECTDMRKRVFCDSMCEVTDGRRDVDAPRLRLTTLIEQPSCVCGPPQGVKSFPICEEAGNFVVRFSENGRQIGTVLVFKGYTQSEWVDNANLTEEVLLDCERHSVKLYNALIADQVRQTPLAPESQPTNSMKLEALLNEGDEEPAVAA